MTDDLFDEPTTPKYGLDDAIHRYRFPPPPGIEPSNRGWRRTTNLVKAFSDQYALQQWLERMTLLGLLANEGLIFDELAAVDFDAERDKKRRELVQLIVPPDSKPTDADLQKVDRKVEQWFKEFLAGYADAARSAVGADAGARKGTARHNLLEHYLFADEVIGHRRMRVQMHDLLEKLDALDIELIPGTQESFVFHPIAGGVVGRRDARFLCRRTGQIGTADLKTSEKFWTYQEHSGQQWIYDTAPWVWEGPLNDEGRWVRQTEGTYVGRPGGKVPGERAALLLHMPSKGGPVDVVEVSLDYGARVVELARDVTELRALGKVVGGSCPA